MKSRPKNRALAYIRRSDDGQEASLGQQLAWAKAEATKLGVLFRGTPADIEEMQRKKLNHQQDIYLDDAVSGGDLTRPGFRKFLEDAIADPTVSHVYVFKRDRLGRPQMLLEMIKLEQDLIRSGVTLVTHDKTHTPEDVKANEMMYLISGLIEYQEHGKFSPRLGDRIVFVQQSMAARGLSTGGRAPYAFGRALVGPNDEFVQWLEDGENIRRAGHHVRFLPRDQEKLGIWCMMLEWRAAGESCKRIAARLNQMGIPSPDTGRTRRDHGSEYRVPGKWHPNTIRDLCSNPIIAGIKEYGRRSEGRYRRVGIDGPRELDEHDLRPDGQPKLLENPLEVRVRASSGGTAAFDIERWEAIQPKKAPLSEARRKGGRKATNPDRYPLSTRVIDLTDGCGSVMHGVPYGGKLKYACGRYCNSGYTECHHNTVEAPAVTAMLVDALIELVDKAGGREVIRERLLAKARAEADTDPASLESPILAALQARLADLNGDIKTAERRMTLEKDDVRYAAIAKTFDTLVSDRADLERQIAELAAPRQPEAPATSTPEEQVDALMTALDDLATLATNHEANQTIRQLVLRLGIFVGLDFEERMWGNRPIRALRRGVIAFGEDNLPVPIHGRNRIDRPNAPVVGDNRADDAEAHNHTQSALACCQGPSVGTGSRRGARNRKNRTDEPVSGLEQTHQGTNVGATPPSLWITVAFSTERPLPFSRNTSRLTATRCRHWRCQGHPEERSTSAHRQRHPLLERHVSPANVFSRESCRKLCREFVASTGSCCWPHQVRQAIGRPFRQQQTLVE
jgi:predicted site-specific integrase-resolvase